MWQEVGKILLILHVGIKLQQVSDGKMPVKNRNIHGDPRRLSLSDRGDIFSSWCAFKVEFLVWLLQLRLPGSYKILCALCCLRSLKFLEKSSEISSSFSWCSSQGSSATEVRLKSWFIGDVCILVIKSKCNFLLGYVIKIPTKVDTFLVVWRPVTKQSSN